MSRAFRIVLAFVLGYATHYVLGGDPIYWWLILRLWTLG